MKNVEIGLGLGGWVEPIIISGMVPLPNAVRRMLCLLI